MPTVYISVISWHLQDAEGTSATNGSYIEQNYTLLGTLTSIFNQNLSWERVVSALHVYFKDLSVPKW